MKQRLNDDQINNVSGGAGGRSAHSQQFKEGDLVYIKLRPDKGVGTIFQVHNERSKGFFYTVQFDTGLATVPESALSSVQ